MNKKPSEMSIEEFNDLIETALPNAEKSDEGDFLHMPISFIEADIRKIYEGRVQIRIIDQKEMFNAICTHCRLEVFHPVHKEWLYYDGTSALSIYYEKPGSYVGSSKVLVAEEIKTAIAGGYSEAFKNAAKRIGPRYGSDLNRVNKPGAVSAYEVIEKPIFNPDGKYTKKELLQLVNQQVITAEQMNDYSAGKPFKPTPEVEAYTGQSVLITEAPEVIEETIFTSKTNGKTAKLKIKK